MMMKTDMKLGVYTWFPYQSSDRCTEVNDITILDSWVISSQGQFTKNTDLFPRKFRNGHSQFVTYYFNHTTSNWNVLSSVAGLEIALLRVVLEQMNMTFVNVLLPKSFEWDVGNLDNTLVKSMVTKEYYIVIANVGKYFLLDPFFDSTNTYNMMKIRWYVQCSDKYPKWSSMFRILSLELWLVLIISIVTAAISTTFVGRYSCTSEWQGYKTLTSSLTNIWALILGVSVSTMPLTQSLRSLFLA
jgi:hypothetical protein